MSPKRSLPPETAFKKWLGVCTFLVFFMILLGGITRLSESGLSIVDWRPITGWLPPLNIEDWAILFDAYRGSPEFKKLNFWMTLEDFKRIFWLEYLHRLLGRIIGLVYFIPFVWFLIRYQVSKQLQIRFSLLLILGTAQGFLGWYMVQSGLIDEPSVDHYRLAVHLGLAVIIYGILLFTLIGIGIHGNIEVPVNLARLLTSLVFLTILWGAFVSGLDGGEVYNTFPLMNGYIVPPESTQLTPIWLNVFENIALVQFFHRILAFTTTAFAIFLVYKYSSKGGWILRLPAIFLVIQLFLGATTVLTGASIYIAWAHQAMALLVFSACITLWRYSIPLSDLD